MEKRVVLALVLSLAVLFLYQLIYERWMVQPPVKKIVSDAKIPERPEKAETSAEVSGAPPIKVRDEIAEILVTVETPLYKAVLSSRGGGVRNWKLKNYRESLEKRSRNVEMIAPDLDAYPLQDELIYGTVSEAVHLTPSRQSVVLDAAGQKEELVFTGRSAEGLLVKKRYRFSADSYSIQIETAVLNDSEARFEGQLSTAITSSSKFIETRGGQYHKGPVLYSDEKVVAKEIKEGEETVQGRIGWGGLEEMYFISVIIPRQMENVIWSSAVTGGLVKTKATVPLHLPADAKAQIAYTAFLGPKEMDILAAQKVRLEDSIDLGWFSFLARPLLVSMNFLYKYIPNYGLVIILLTIVIKIVFHPLTKKGLDSMKEMQKIQPQIAAVRERYKDDKEKMNRELMELYKRYKINPLGGCLPIALQIPVFIALYNVLSISIELRHAPFALWIHDLSAKDPYYVTPILMGATMLIQQKMTPSSMDPTQAKLMLIMPVVFTFMFLSFPSGLVLYWLINNVLSIAQQYYIQKTTK